MRKEQVTVKLFGKYHDFVILFVGFILTTVMGGFLSYYVQERSWKHQHEASLLQQEQQAATKVFEEISRLMDKRLYCMRLLHTGLVAKVHPEKMEKRWNAYREVLFEWNDNLNRNLALIQRYFGYDERYLLLHEIIPRFIKFGARLENFQKQDSSPETFHDLLEMADELNNWIYNFDIILIESIQRKSNFLGKNGNQGITSKISAPQGGKSTQLKQSSADDYYFSVHGTSSGVADNSQVKMLLWVHPCVTPFWYLQKSPTTGIKVLEANGKWEGVGQLGDHRWPPREGDTFDVAITVVDNIIANDLLTQSGIVTRVYPFEISKAKDEIKGIIVKIETKE